MKLAVLGSGAFGTALAVSMTTSVNSVTLWGRNPKQVAALSENVKTNSDCQTTYYHKRCT
jgi:glycerol-3-phosphate dehydrogenase (NAD(P)+)